MAFKVSEKPERWLLGLCRLVVWSKDPEGMCVRATGVCGGLRALPPRPPAPLQGFSCRGVLARAGALPQVRAPTLTPARVVGTAGVPPLCQSGPPYILLNLQFRFLGQARVEASGKLGPARLIPPTSRLAGAAHTPGPITPGSARKHFMGHVATGSCHLGDHCLDFPLLLEPNKICQRKIFVWF